MKKKVKLNLKELKVRSFITSSKERSKIKGGDDTLEPTCISCDTYCDTICCTMVMTCGTCLTWEPNCTRQICTPCCTDLTC